MAEATRAQPASKGPEGSPGAARPGFAGPGHDPSEHLLLQLQRTHGNQAVLRMLEGRLGSGEATGLGRMPAIRRLQQNLPYVGPLLSYLNPANQLRRGLLPGLSDAQKGLLDGIFGNSLATSIIRLNPNSLLAAGNCYRTTGSVINMPGDTIDDSHLIHEAAHVWQSQNTVFGVGYAVSALRAQAIAQVLGGDWQRAYDYRNVEEHRIPWRYWNAEQQAAWIQANRRPPRGGCCKASSLRSESNPLGSTDRRK